MTKCKRLLFLLPLLVFGSIGERRLSVEHNITKQVCYNYDSQKEVIKEELDRRNGVGVLLKDEAALDYFVLSPSDASGDGNGSSGDGDKVVPNDYGKNGLGGILINSDKLNIRKYYTNLNSSDCRISILKRRSNIKISRNIIYMMKSFDRVLELLDILSSRRECPYCKGCNDIRLGSLPIWVSPILHKRLRRINYELDYKLCYILKKDLRVYNEIKNTILRLKSDFGTSENRNKDVLYDVSPVDNVTFEILRKNYIGPLNVSVLGVILETKFDDLKIVGSKLNHCVPLQFLFKCSWHPNKQSKDILSKLNVVSNIMFDISNSLEISFKLDPENGAEANETARADLDAVYSNDGDYVNAGFDKDTNYKFKSNRERRTGSESGKNARNNVENVLDLHYFDIRFGSPNITDYEDVFMPNKSKTKASIFSKSSFANSFSNKNSNLFGYREHSSSSDSVLSSAQSHSAAVSSSSLSSSSPSSSSESSSSVNSLPISSNKCVSPFLDTMVIPKDGLSVNEEFQICDFELGANLDIKKEAADSIKSKGGDRFKEDSGAKADAFGMKDTRSYGDREYYYYDDDEDEYGDKLRVIHGMQYVHHIAAIQYDYASSSSNSKLLAWGDGIMHPKSVQSSNPDSYLLVPCNRPMWFVIGFQEDIFLEFISIFSLEYFSSSYKDIEISGSLVYPTKNWVPIGIIRRNEKLSKEMFDIKPLCMREEDSNEGRRERTFADIDYIGEGTISDKKDERAKGNARDRNGQKEYSESVLAGYKNKRQKKYNSRDVEKKSDRKKNDNSNNGVDRGKDGGGLGPDGGKYEYSFSPSYSYSNPCWVRYIKVRALSSFEEGHYYCHLNRIQIFGNNIISKLEAEINGKRRNYILIRGDGEESVKEVENRLLKRDPSIINGNIQDRKEDPGETSLDNSHGGGRNNNGNKVNMMSNNGVEGDTNSKNVNFNGNSNSAHFYGYNHGQNHNHNQNSNVDQQKALYAETRYDEGGGIDNSNNEFVYVNSSFGNWYAGNNRDRYIGRNLQKQEDRTTFSYNDGGRHRYAYNNINEYENEALYPNFDYYRTQDMNYHNNHPLLSFVEKVKVLEKKINLLKIENRAILSELNSTKSHITESVMMLSDSIRFLQDILMLDSNYNITSASVDMGVGEKKGIGKGGIGRTGDANINNIGNGLNGGGTIGLEDIGVVFKDILNKYFDNYLNIECLIKPLSSINSFVLVILRSIVEHITVLIFLLIIVILVTSQVFLYKQLFSIKKRLQNTLQFIKSCSNNPTPTAKNSKGGLVLDEQFSFQKNAKLHSNPVGINLVRGLNGHVSGNLGGKPQNSQTNYVMPSLVLPSSSSPAVENIPTTVGGVVKAGNDVSADGGGGCSKGSGNESGARLGHSDIIKDIRDSYCESNDRDYVLQAEAYPVSVSTCLENVNQGFPTKTEREEVLGDSDTKAVKKEQLKEEEENGEVDGEIGNNVKRNPFSVLGSDVQNSEDQNQV
ncbi:hypothetical protein FG386_000172 [Cryptosporidium ryanae]|uniref:uncharacterized protein n=1 Tax=Cryptosporidium ryanae TaxID=515981 RepID=UPI00351A1569|nr:hypothetical protein FG386_000172 [Cryptosporidium ryanae]